MDAHATTMHRDTPQLMVVEPRSLAVRSVDYYRAEESKVAESRVNLTAYDPAGRAIGQWDPRLFLEASAPANLSTIHGLNGTELCIISVDAGLRVSLFGESGQPVHTWDGRGSQRWMHYDNQVRLTAVFEQAAEGEAVCAERLTYAANDQAVADHNQCGQLIRHDDPAGTQLFEAFGLTGGVLEQTRHFLRALESPDWPEPAAERNEWLEPGPGATTRSRLNPLGESVEQTDAQGNRQLFSHTVAGQLREVRLQLQSDTTPKTLVSAIQYNAHGQTEREVAGNGVITTLEYAPEDVRLMRLHAKRGNDVLQDSHYEYDPKGNVLSIEDAAVPIRYFANQRIDPISRYFYDSLYQLIRATGWEAGSANKGPQFSAFDDPAPRGNYCQTYRYDRGGNLLELSHEGPQNHGHRLVAALFSNRCLPVVEGVEPGEEDFRRGFDANGNLRKLPPGQSLSWDLRNQLCEVRPVERDGTPHDSERYIYGADGMRVRKVRSTQTNARTVIAEVRYLQNLEIRTHSGTGEVFHVITVQAGRSSVRVLHWESATPKESANDQYRFCLNDHLGSCTLELDSDGEVISQERYHPFGTTAWFAGRGEVEASRKTVRYSGKERDATGLYYYGFRYYVAWLQRWLNPDPARDADGMNFYAMVRGNPIGFRDPDGQISELSELFKPARGDMKFGLTAAIHDSLDWWGKVTFRGDYLSQYFTGDDIAKLESELNPYRDSYSAIRSYSRVQGAGKDAFWNGGLADFKALVGYSEQKFYTGVQSKYSGWLTTAANNKFAGSFARELEGSRYSVMNTFKKFIDENEDVFNRKLLSRASKAGIQTILNSGRDDEVHFILDGIDMDQVVSKSRPSATSSELRFVFRNRNETTKVNFYEGGRRVQAPWEKDPAQWSRYKPKSATFRSPSVSIQTA